LVADFDGSVAPEALASEYGSQLHYVAGRAKEQLGLSAALIRPDGFVAWAADKESDVSECQQAAARWFSGNTQSVSR
jgi:hypothetical protein